MLRANAPSSPASPAPPATAPVGANPFVKEGESAPRGPIDTLVFATLKRRGIVPARICSDGVFLRRAYLDVIGTLPTADEARGFLNDPAPNKRGLLVERLLERPEFADYRAMQWSDLLRVKSEFPINLWPNAVQAYHRWIRDAMRDNMPWDRFARELLTASGSNFRVPPVNFYRAVQSRKPEGIARTVALTLMGARAEKWSPARLAGMSAFFAQVDYKSTGEWKEEIVLHNPDKAAVRPAAPVVYPDGTPVRLLPGQDPRRQFADWLISPKNPWFARNAVNRIWSRLMGRGIVHEVDDIRPDNPPRIPELMAYLEKELIAARWDTKHIYRLILKSTVYQLSSIPRSKKPEAEAYFAQYALRRLDAEVLIDALNQITGTTESYSSAAPEPFTFIPEEQRSVALADGSITSAFLEMFGRPARDTGVESERNNRPTFNQSMHLLNSSHIRRKLENGPGLNALMRTLSGPALIDAYYLTILSRLPSDTERATLAEYARKGTLRPREVAQDLAWALVNSTEFLYRH